MTCTVGLNGVNRSVSRFCPAVHRPGLAAEMLIHHNVFISQRLRERSGGMRGAMATWHRRQAGGQRSEATEERTRKYRGLAFEINRPRHELDFDVFMG